MANLVFFLQGSLQSVVAQPVFQHLLDLLLADSSPVLPYHYRPIVKQIPPVRN